MARQFTTDCEGPISKNDNAQELSAHLIPEGQAFFALVSKYDDFLADVLKKPGYKAGDTLKLILPFLIAFGATNKSIQNYSRSHILLVPGARETLRFVRSWMASYIISTSYEPYIRALCDVVDFPVNQVFFTQVDVDRYALDPDEKSWLKEKAREIAAMETLEWGEDAEGIEDLPEDDQDTLKRFDQIFWETIPQMKIGRIFNEVNPMGGIEKANAVRKSLKTTGIVLKDVMYVGDSITDVQALELVREHGGLAVSFNGNGYAVRSSQICCMSSDARVIAILADVFNKLGRDAVLDLASVWEPEDLNRFSIDRNLLDWLNTIPKEISPRVDLITDSNRKHLTVASEAFRKSVRGVEIGSLG
ncbi:MAG: HAD hydrolase family protein [Proteobacteria bacterium]|nr:HAD hydrolase family protein [Pseudomonadota bacterium]NIS67620.1 HAD hydrolase family protein [Pseudomonadota bacterium]